MITSSSLKHPVMKEKILNALIEANELAVSRHGRGTVYIPNAKGHNIMRLDVYQPCADHPQGNVIVFGEGSRQITKAVDSAMGVKLVNIL
jgi:hypothetical protein